MASEWQVPKGEVLTRTQIHGSYGGGSQGGIEPSATTPNVIVYSDKFAGEEYGYVFDGWSSGDEALFYYSGEGQLGDQKLTAGNAAILYHTEQGRALRLFVTLDRRQRPGGKRHRYIGEFHIDPEHPYDVERGMDRHGDERDVIVFRLLAVDASRFEADAGVRGAEAATIEVTPDEQAAATPERADSESTATVTFVDPENHEIFEVTRPPKAGQVAVKAEASLVQQWEHALRAKGHEVKRARISIDGERGDIITDSLDQTTRILYEAKSCPDRSTVRLAIGQLIDYLRFLDSDLGGAVLLPAAPTKDVGRLISSCGFGLVYRELGSWIIKHPDN